MIVITRALVLAAARTYSQNNPVIGWHNIVTAENISSDEEDADYPLSNLGNPDTSLEWRGETASEQTITIQPGDLDGSSYVGFARTNFGSAGIAVLIEGRASALDSFVDLDPEQMPADDGPLMFLFDLASYYEIRITLAAGAAAPRIGVLYCGRYLRMQRPLWSGHVPLKYARRTTIIDGASESGEFLGRIQLGEFRRTTARFENITAGFYRQHVDPFLASARQYPFFWAAQPQIYPGEAGFARLMNDPLPAPSPHHMAFELVLQGIT